MAERLGVIDIGGTTIKFGLWEAEHLTDEGSVKTPATLAEFYTVIQTTIDRLKATHQLTGVAISSPGAVNQATGVIEGSSALPYIHEFPIRQQLTTLLGLPVSIENDANCAALAEIEAGAGQDNQDLLFLVIGTGVGGAVIKDRKVWHGAHLFGGEFGYMLANPTQILSEVASPVSMAKRYNAQMKTSVSGKTVFALAKQSDRVAKHEVATLIDALASAIYNLQYSFDPEKIILGGAVSNNPDLIPMLNQKLDEIRALVKIATVAPKLALCEYRGAANLRGAVVNFSQTSIG